MFVNTSLRGQVIFYQKINVDKGEDHMSKLLGSKLSLTKSHCQSQKALSNLKTNRIL